MSKPHHGIAQQERDLLQAIERLQKQLAALSELAQANHEVLKTLMEAGNASTDKLIKWLPGLGNSR